MFGKKNRLRLSLAITETPPETRMATMHEWELPDDVERHIGEMEVRIRERIAAKHRPATVATLDPLDDMPGQRSARHGLTGTPKDG